MIERMDGFKGSTSRSAVHPFPPATRLERPKGWEGHLLRAILKSSHTIKDEAPRLVVSFACGELLHLGFVMDQLHGKGGEPTFRHSLVGVWRVEPPADAVLWFEDATGDPEIIRRLLNRPVTDQTPKGRLTARASIRQCHQDITRGMSDGTVRKLLRGVLACHKDARRVGVILHKPHRHVKARLGEPWRSRIERLSYFGSGEERSSNQWLDCDLLVVLGTPRVNPGSIRRGLIQLGRLEAAAADGGWGEREWTGRTSEGKQMTVRGRGYRNDDWALVHRLLVRGALLQAIGRGRAVTDQGVPVVVLSNEELGKGTGAVLADTPLRRIGDEAAQVYEYIVSGKLHEVTSRDVAHRFGVTDRQARNHLTFLRDCGLLTRASPKGPFVLA
jgi:hypothetical protein